MTSGWKSSATWSRRLLVLQQGFRHREIRVLQQHGVTALLQPDVVVVRHAVIAVDAEALSQEQLRQVIADEAGSPRDQYLPL